MKTLVRVLLQFYKKGKELMGQKQYMKRQWMRIKMNNKRPRTLKDIKPQIKKPSGKINIKKTMSKHITVKCEK